MVISKCLEDAAVQFEWKPPKVSALAPEPEACAHAECMRSARRLPLAAVYSLRKCEKADIALRSLLLDREMTPQQQY